MKRIIATAGLAALGASSLQAQYTQGLVPADQSKPWWVGLTVRGFYDSNYLTQYGGDDKDSWGISVTPSVGINFNLENTLISASYVFDLRWFEAPESGNSQYSQIANLALSHAFSERVSVDVTERFIAAQEGTIVVDGPIAAPGNNGMTDSDYLRNTVGASVDWSMTEKVGLTFSYLGDWWNYEQEGINSRSALLNRWDHLPAAEVFYKVQPTTKALVGYQFGVSDYYENEQWYFYTGNPSAPTANLVDSDARNRWSQYIYAGIEHEFTPQLKGALRAGAQFTDYQNDEKIKSIPGNNFDSSDVIPYVNASLTYTYNPGSYVQLGLINTINATDVGAVDQQSLAFWGSLTHRISTKWTLNLLGMFQNSDFQGGAYDGSDEQLYIAGANLSYLINQYLTAEFGYNYDCLAGNDVPNRGYNRNRAYIGLSARY